MTDDREIYWRRRLVGFRLGAEPLAEQVDRHRRTTWALTAVALFFAMMFLGLFSAFGHPGFGAIMAGTLIGPIIAAAWLRFWRIGSRATAYEREVAAGEPTGL